MLTQHCVSFLVMFLFYFLGGDGGGGGVYSVAITVTYEVIVHPNFNRQ